MRTQSSMKNLMFAISGQSIGLLLSFIARIAFIRVLGEEYLGLNGLLTNILSILALVELGVGPALTFSLYKPLANNDIEKIKSLMKLYQKAYVSIGILIALLGISLTPFLDYFIKDTPDIPFIELIFLIFVANSTISYFYSYKRSLITSDQKRYIATIYRYSVFAILNIIQIFVLYLTHNYIFFLLCQFAATLIENILVSKTAERLYPYLKESKVQKLDKITLTEISRNIRAMMAHKLGGVVVLSTDNVIISKFVGLTWVGMYSNYLLIIYGLNVVIGQVFSSITASVGNLGVKETDNKKKSIFNVVLFMNFWIYSFSSICLIVLINPFINIWIGKEYMLDIYTVLIIIFNFYLTGMRKAVLTFKDAMGLYWQDRYKPIFEVIINLTFALILVRSFGLIGVLIGTTISTLATCFWVEPYILYKYGFKSSSLPFFGRYLIYKLITILTCLITVGFANLFSEMTIINFIFRLIICILIPNLLFILFFRKTSEFKYLFNLIDNLVFSKLKSFLRF
jgi:O-antigen/teichoic acid export membrane protein